VVCVCACLAAMCGLPASTSNDVLRAIEAARAKAQAETARAEAQAARVNGCNTGITGFTLTLL